jgi:uncharacterized protein YdcH (DUF465 family)
MYQDFLGKPRNSLRQEQLISELCSENARFNRWFEDKFLKWEYDPVDSDDVETLEESVTKALLERYSE